MHFEAISHLAYSRDSAGELGRQLLLMNGGYLSAENNRSSNHLDFNQTQTTQGTVIEEEPHSLGEMVGIVDSPIATIFFRRIHALLLQ